MLGITHNEVRRHPRWREELRTPQQTSNVPHVPGSRLLGVVAVLIVATAVVVVLLST